MKTKLITITLLSIGVLLIAFPAVANDELIGLESLVPGRTEGTGTYFEIKNSEYLNISLQSIKEITILLESVFKTISLNIEASTLNSSTILTIEGLEPNKTYHKYEDSYKNEAVFVSDGSGSYSWTQDLTESHHIWIQDLIQSLYILTQEATGAIFLPEDCEEYGNWNEEVQTCYLTQNVTSSIEIITNTITLNCDNHNLTGDGGGYGIYLNSKNGVTIKNCNIDHFAHGISLQSSYSNTFTNNIVSDNRGAGIYLYYSDGNFFASSTSLSSGNQGIILNGSNDNIFTGNNVLNGNLFGFYISASSDNILTNNTIAGNPYNFYLFGTILGPGVYTRVGLQNYIDTTNTVDGKPIYYIIGATDQIYDGSTNAGIFYCIDCNNVTIKDLNIQNTAHGIFLWNTNDSTIENVTTSNIGYGGINLYDSDYNTIVGSTGQNNGYGIAGLFTHSGYNTIYNNTSRNSWAGIYLYYSNNNNIYHNNLIDNERQISNSYGTGNNFDNSYPSGGNYFNNYTGIDVYSGLNQDESGSDGIGDTHHAFYGGQDNYPFMVENGWEALNQPPTLSNMGQFKSDDISPISEGAITTESTVVFKASLNDSDNDQVKLQVELREMLESFTGIFDGGILESEFISSGSEATITRIELVNGQYHWRARAVDFQGNTSGWQEFGTQGNMDFAVKLVPLYTQVRSDYPSDEETRSWFEEDYAEGPSGNYDCGSKIEQCGCAITSAVMVLRYHDILMAIDDNDVNPSSINDWLNNHNGYSAGAVNWLKVPEYSGYKIKFDTNNSGDYLNNYAVLEEYLNNNHPAIAKEIAGRGGMNIDHFIVIDNKLAFTYGIKDSAWYNTKKLNEPVTDVAGYIRDYNNNFDGLRLFYPSDGIAVSTISLILASPAELLIIDPWGRRLGRDPMNEIEYKEIPNSTYFRDVVNDATGELPPGEQEIKAAYISYPEDGFYDIKVIGTGAGTYTLILLAYDQNGQSKDIEQQGDIITGAIQEFELNYSLDAIEETTLHQIVEIDIKPGSDPNSINCQNQKDIITVTVLTTEIFDATSVDPETVRFGPDGAQEIHRDRNGKAKTHLEDVDKDDDLDTIFHFRFEDTGIQCSDQDAILTGKTLDGFDVSGLDSIRTVGGSIKKSFLSEFSFLLANLPEILSPLLELLQIKLY